MLYINKKGGVSTKRIERNSLEGKKRDKSRNKNRYCSRRKVEQEVMLAYA